MSTNPLCKMIPLDCLLRGQYQPRTEFTEAGLKELAQSIKTHGLIEPLVVRQLFESKYEIIAGERRWRAAMIVGLSEVPCLITVYNDQQAASVALIENIQRQDLSLIEEANGYQRLISEFLFSQNEIATLVGKSRSHIANLLRLLTLCPSVHTYIHLGQLSLGHARMLVGLDTGVQKKLAQQVIDNQWSVRKLEDAVRAAKRPSQTNNTISDRDLARLETLLAEQMGTPVELLQDSLQGGWLKIKFYNNDTLAGLLDRMGLRYD